MKQKQGQFVDSFLSNLHLSLPRCQYGAASACEQLKDQFIFGVTICEVQDNLHWTIKKDDGIKNALMKPKGRDYDQTKEPALYS